MTTHTIENDRDGVGYIAAKLLPRKPAYRKALSISDPTIWRWTRAGKLSPADAVINGREYSTPQTIDADVKALMDEYRREVAE